jgi:hypothetical protein
MFRHRILAMLASAVAVAALGSVPAAASTPPYRFGRTTVPGGYGGWISIATYPGIVKAARSNDWDVWIDSTKYIHNAHGPGYAEFRTPLNPGWYWRACGWFIMPLNNRKVVCSPWVRGY